jgi:hypothetical protein
MTKATELLKTPAFSQAVSQIQKRAEKEELSRVAEVFFKTDLFQRAYAPNSQLILGRRGTGKTQLLRALQFDAVNRGLVVQYIDCTALSRVYGTAICSDAIAGKYFSAFLEQLQSLLLEETIKMEMPDKDKEASFVNRLANGFPFETALVSGEVTFNYLQIRDTLISVLKDLGINRLSLVLDEWVQIPVEAQPFFAEHLKRAVLSVPQITVKILAVNYQCNLLIREGSSLIGLERGADLPDLIDMDRYFVWDEKRDFVVDYFAQLLYNHLGIELRLDLTILPEQKRKWIEQLVYSARYVCATSASRRRQFKRFPLRFFKGLLR